MLLLARLDEPIKIGVGESVARSRAASPDVDVPERAVIDKLFQLLGSGTEPGRSLRHRQQRAGDHHRLAPAPHRRNVRHLKATEEVVGIDGAEGGPDVGGKIAHAASGAVGTVATGAISMGLPILMMTSPSPLCWIDAIGKPWDTTAAIRSRTTFGRACLAIH